jgi:transglutaminase-like putative cysteine protease
MGQRHADGVIIDNSVFIIDEKKPGFPISARVYQFLAIIIGSWSSISVLMESLAVPVNVFHMNAAILIAVIIMFVLCLHPTYNVVKLFFGVLIYVLFFFSRLPKIQNGFYILENLVLSRIESYYGYQEIQYKANYATATVDTTLLVIMILVPIVTLLSIAVVRSRFINLCSIILFLPVSGSFLLGIIPSERYLIAYVVAVLYLSQSGYSFHHVTNKEQKTLLHRIHSRAAVWLSLMGVMLFFLMKLFVTPERYEDVAKIKEMKTEMQSTLFNFSIEDVTKRFTDFHFPDYSVSVGGLNGGDLGKTGQVRFTNTEHLRITAPLTSVTEGIYLKGYVGSVYTGDKWEGHSNEDIKQYQNFLKKISVSEFAPINQVSMLLNRFADQSGFESAMRLKIPQFHYYLGKMNIEYMAANEKYLYAPYFTDYNQLDQMHDLQDLYAAPVKKKDHYELNYSFDIALGASASDFYYNVVQGNLGKYSSYEKLYRDYVYQVYTKVPEKGLERLKKDFGTTKATMAMITIPEKIEYVKNYLQQNTQYSLSPGKLPKGKDYVEYFLYENKTGYCAHYASAATLMLRLMGIPARYVEGYAVGSADIVQNQENSTQDVTYLSDSGSSVNNVVQAEITVRDYNAHAWVEVYIDNCGWIPVEFTPGSAVEYNYTVMEDMATVGDNISHYEEELKDQTVALEDPTPTPAEEEEEQSVEKQEQDNITIPDNDTTKEEAKYIDNLFLVMFLILLVGVVMIFIILKLRISKRARHIKNHNKKALFLFIEIEKILTVCHSLPKRARLEDSEDHVKEHCPYIDSEVFEGFMETVRKARFGKGKITRKELKEVEQFYQTLQEEAYEKLPFGKRIYLKFILFA